MDVEALGMCPWPLEGVGRTAMVCPLLRAGRDPARYRRKVLCNWLEPHECGYSGSRVWKPAVGQPNLNSSVPSA